MKLAHTLLALALLTPLPAVAQQPTPRPETPGRTTPVPPTDAERVARPFVTGPLTYLKIDVVIARYQGDRKISSLPYVLSVNANDNVPTSLRIGAQVALPNGTYGNVGTNIDCTARMLEEGRFRLTLAIDDSSVYPSDSTERTPVASPTLPTLRTFKATSTAVLRQGQSAQFVSATDKLTGESVKVDVTLSVVK